MNRNFAIVVLVLLLALVSNMDYEDEKAEEISYCESVKNGVWPDYKGIYADVCEAEHGKAKKFKNISL